jgi:beta-glucosidase
MSMIANEPDDYFAGMMEAMSLQNNHTHTQLQERVKSSARRVLQLKHKLHMFEEVLDMRDSENMDQGPSPEALQAALEMTHQSIILAENKDNVLPLVADQPLNVLVTGPTSHSLSFQTGGWTGQWQGVDSNKEGEWFTYGSTVLQALQREAQWQVSYACGVDILGRDCQPDVDDELQALQQEQHSNSGSGVMGTIKGWVGFGDEDDDYLSIERAMKQAANGMDVIVVCVGEENYTEKPGDIRSLQLPSGQYELVAGLRQAAPQAKIVLVYFGGRPRLLADIVVRSMIICRELCILWDTCFWSTITHLPTSCSRNTSMPYSLAFCRDPLPEMPWQIY